MTSEERTLDNFVVTGLVQLSARNNVQLSMAVTRNTSSISWPTSRIAWSDFKQPSKTDMPLLGDRDGDRRIWIRDVENKELERLGAARVARYQMLVVRVFIRHFACANGLLTTAIHLHDPGTAQNVGEDWTSVGVRHRFALRWKLDKERADHLPWPFHQFFRE